MARLWLLRGAHETSGWKKLEQDARAKAVDLLGFNRSEWALVYADERPSAYDGFAVEDPTDGLYIADNGMPFYVVGNRHVADPYELVTALGEDAQRLFDKLGDVDVALQRLGRVY